LYFILVLQLKSYFFSFRDLDEKINEFKNKKVVELQNLDYEDYINNFVYEFDLPSSEELKINILLFEEKKKKVRK
jgi:hypothetical protein